MAECGFFPECGTCTDCGESWIPCDGRPDGTVCSAYQPMPDVDALLKLADEMEAEGLDGWAHTVNVGDYARRIREALGAER